MTLEEDGGGLTVDLAALFATVLARLLQLAAGLDCRQTLIDQFKRNGLDGFFKNLRKGFYEIGGFAEGSIHVARQPEQNQSDLLSGRQQRDFFRERGITLGRKKGEGTRERAGRVAEREPDPFAAVIDGKNPHKASVTAVGSCGTPIPRDDVLKIGMTKRPQMC